MSRTSLKLKHPEASLYSAINAFKRDNTDTCVMTHTIHIPVMEKAAKLTGRTIQAVIGLAVSWCCPKHGVRGGGGFGSEWQHDRRDQVGGGWGCGVTNTMGDTHKEGMRGQRGDGTAPLLRRTQQPAAT